MWIDCQITVNVHHAGYIGQIQIRTDLNSKMPLGAQLTAEAQEWCARKLRCAGGKWDVAGIACVVFNHDGKWHHVSNNVWPNFKG